MSTAGVCKSVNERAENRRGEAGKTTQYDTDRRPRPPTLFCKSLHHKFPRKSDAQVLLGANFPLPAVLFPPFITWLGCSGVAPSQALPNPYQLEPLEICMGQLCMVFRSSQKLGLLVTYTKLIYVLNSSKNNFSNTSPQSDIFEVGSTMLLFMLEIFCQQVEHLLPKKNLIEWREDRPI